MNSEQTNELAAALAKAQGAMENAKLNKANPYFKSKYADLASVIDAIKKPLADNGLGFTQTTYIADDKLVLVTKLMHASGQWIESEYPLPLAPDKPQAMGSAMTYARRYALAALCGIAAEEDDDANAAQAAAGAKKPPKPAPDVMQTRVAANPSGELPQTQRPGEHDPKTGEIIEPPKQAPPKDSTPDFGNPDGIDIKDMAREAAMRGREVIRAFYKSRNAEEQAKIKKILPELDKIVEAVEAQMADEEGS